MKIESKAAIKRLPIGTRLVLVNSLMGQCYIPRVIHEVKSNQILMKLDDGRISHLYLDQTGEKVEATESGFRILTDEGRIAVEYIVEAL